MLKTIVSTAFIFFASSTVASEYMRTEYTGNYTPPKETTLTVNLGKWEFTPSITENSGRITGKYLIEKNKYLVTRVSTNLSDVKVYVGFEFRF